MVLRLLIASFLIFGTINVASYDVEGDEEITVEDSVPFNDEAEDVAPSNVDPPVAAPVQQPAEDLKVKDLIRTLETDPERTQLINTLKALNQSNAAVSQQFVFMNAVVGIKNFLKSIVSEFKGFINGLGQEQTWDIRIDSDVFKTSGQDKLLSLLYVVLVALVVQILIANMIGGAAPPLFGRFDEQSDLRTVIRTLIALGIFFVGAYVAKINFVDNASDQAYVEESVLTIVMLQFGFVLLRLAIARRVLPVNPDYQRSLIRAAFVLTLLWGGYAYLTDLMLSTSQASILPRPVSQLFFGIVLLISLWVLKRYRHVIEGMLFRPLPNSKNRLLVGVQHIVSNCMLYVIVIAVIMMYIAWFVQNQALFLYFRDQLIITLVSLLTLSIASYIVESSSEHFSSGSEQGAKITAVTHRLIDGLAFITVMHLVYRWLTPLIEMQGISTAKISDKLFGIFIIVALTVVVMHGLNRIFNRSNKMIGGNNKQLKTFMPILDRLSKLVVLIVAGLLLLIELNINVMPIVASFSVLGLGVGLASKSIIEDFMNGLLVVQENDFNIGDKITVGGITGVIENITLRKLHLRDNQGYLSFIPFSNIGAITNQSRDYNKDKLTIPLPSGFHLKQTAHILEDVGKQMLHDPDLKAYIISLPKFIGVSEFQISSHQSTEIVSMMQFELTTAPEKMNLIAGEFRKLAKLAFEEIEKIR